MTPGLRLVTDDTSDPRDNERSLATALDGYVAAVRAGDHEAFSAVYHALAQELVRFAAEMLDDVASAEDIVEDVFVELWEQRAIWTPSHGVRAYIFRAVRNDVIDALRRAQLHTRIHGSLTHDQGVPGMASPPVPLAHALDVAEQVNAVFQTIAQFGEARRTAMMLYWANELSVPEIADIMGITQNAVYHHLKRGLSALKQHMPDRRP